MWEIAVGAQVMSALYSVLLGCILCALYDFFRAARLVVKSSNTAVFISDLFFWLVSAFSVFLLLLSLANGEVRAYILLSVLMGFLLFRLVLSYFLVSFLRIVIGAAVWLKRKLFAILSFFLHRLYAACGAVVKNTVKMLKKLLKKYRVLVYTKHNRETIDSEI